MASVLIVGGTRGLGKALVDEYVKSGKTVYATSRSPVKNPDSRVKWLDGVDLTKSTVGEDIIKLLGESKPLESVTITAGVFHTEDFNGETNSGGLDWKAELAMYTTSSIAPVFIVQALAKGGFLTKGSKVVLVSSESGSTTLRHESEGGGNYGHHASKAAVNMVGKLLSLDLKEEGVVVSVVHPGFMRTEMTKGVGFDKYWDDGGAVTPEVAAESLVKWTEGLDMSKSGQYWAPRGPKDIGTAPHVLGEGLPTPLQLPW